MEETIELRHLIKIILNGKWLIAIFTIVALLIAGIVSWFVIEEKYESKAVIQISSGLPDTGIISNYISAEFTPTIYTQRMQNVEQNKKYFKEKGLKDFNKDNLTMLNQPNSDLVELSYQGASPEEAKQYLLVLMEKTKGEMSLSIKKTLNMLEQTYLRETTNLSNEIEQLITKYNNIIVSNRLPEVLILQTISSSQFVLSLTSDQTNALATVTGSLQNELLQLKAQLDTKSEEYSNVLSTYQSVKTELDSFESDPFIRVIVEPTLAEDIASPNKVLNLVIGLILGLMIGVSWVFFRAYWKNTTEVK
jgi:chain length determinant protein (polysaccharide antigen chain regulator)